MAFYRGLEGSGFHNWVTLAATVAIAVATITYTYYAVKQWRAMLGANRITQLSAEAAKSAAKTAADTLNEMKQDRRAWIAPINARVTQSFSTGKSITVELQYSNVGKEPAFDVRPIYTFKQVSGSRFSDNTFKSIIETDDICKNVKIAPGAEVIYPNQPEGYKLIFGLPPNWAGDDLVSGKNALVVGMCFAYRTLGEVHHTSLCY
jgi:hypothetical protein